MAYHTAPLANGHSPAELLMGSNNRTPVSVIPSQLNPGWADLGQSEENWTKLQTEPKTIIVITEYTTDHSCKKVTMSGSRTSLRGAQWCLMQACQGPTSLTHQEALYGGTDTISHPPIDQQQLPPTYRKKLTPNYSMTNRKQWVHQPHQQQSVILVSRHHWKKDVLLPEWEHLQRTWRTMFAHRFGCLKKEN